MKLLRSMFVALVALFFRRRGPEPEADPPPEPESPTRELETGAKPWATNTVVALTLLAAAGFAAFTVLYIVLPDTQLLGVAVGGGILLLGIALALAGKAIVPQEKAESEYHDFGDHLEQVELERTIRAGGEGISRRGLLVAAGGVVAVTGAAAAAVPLASLGPSAGEQVFPTPWRPGRRLVGTSDEPVRASDVEEGEFLTAFPEGAARDTFGAPLIVLRLPVEELDLPADRRAGAPEGILAFSKICTHAGCAVSMYRTPQFAPNEPGPALVCPCHYSTFDPRRGGAVEFGPAARALPQLPISIGSDGILVATGDFFEPVGPSYAGVRLHAEEEETE
jgi:ubiquinol-cytochrome c reductase iron-sulfur subunit